MTEAADKPPIARRLPDHLRRRLPAGGKLAEVEAILAHRGLHTVCQSAQCPNRGECFGKGTATFMILGDSCTRDCRFCAVPHNAHPAPPDADEADRIADAVGALGLRYIVITSVTRDDLALGGAEHFVRCIERLRGTSPGVRIEVLVPDFRGVTEAVDLVLDAGPDVFNHNVETAPELYAAVRPQADYNQSLAVLRRAADRPEATRPVVKSGLMVGLGESREQLDRVFSDLAGAGCDMLTIGQYLAPGKSHHPVVEFLEPEEFERLGDLARARGIRQVFSGPFVRSSYHAGEQFEEIPPPTR